MGGVIVGLLVATLGIGAIVALHLRVSKDIPNDVDARCGDPLDEPEALEAMAKAVEATKPKLAEVFRNQAAYLRRYNR